MFDSHCSCFLQKYQSAPKHKKTTTPVYAPPTAAFKAARFFENVHKKQPFFGHKADNVHKKGSNAVRVAPFRAGLLFNKFGLYLGNFLVYLLAYKVHKVQQELAI